MGKYLLVAMFTVNGISLQYEGRVGQLFGAMVACEVLWMEHLPQGTGKWPTGREGEERGGGRGERERVGERGGGRC